MAKLRSEEVRPAVIQHTDESTGAVMIADEARWPLLLLRGEASNRTMFETCSALCRVTDLYLARRVPFGFVIDARRQPLPDAKTRKLLGDFAREREHAFARYVLADATAIDNAALRGAITAVHWFAPPKHPVGVFGTVEEAADWAIGLLHEAGLRVPD